MSSDFSEDLALTQRELESARQDLLAGLDQLTDADLERARRGGWSVGRVVHHLIQSEWHYAHLVRRLREREPTPPPDAAAPPTSIAEARRSLTASRQALLDALDGIEEASFYRLGALGREEYSVLSVLENAAHHDREHGQQLRGIVASG